MQKKIKEIRSILSSKGLRMTNQRKIVAKAIFESSDHPDVAEIFRRSSRKDKSLSMSTVYRTIRLFSKMGIIDKHFFGTGKIRVEGLEGDRHFHVIDSENGDVFEIECPEAFNALADVVRKKNKDICSVKAEIYVKSRDDKKIDNHSENIR